jgi:hypothetical protein
LPLGQAPSIRGMHMLIASLLALGVLAALITGIALAE